MIPTRDVSGWNVGDHEGAFSRFAGVGWGEAGVDCGGRVWGKCVKLE